MKDLNIEKSKADMRRGMLEFCMLLIIAEGKMYTTDILKKLKEADLIVVEGTLYPLVNRLRREGLLEYEWEESPNGPPRKYYSLTSQGKEYLEQLKTTWKSLTKSINSLIK